MSDFSIGQFCENIWNSYVSVFEEPNTEVLQKKKTVVNSFEKRPPSGELRELEGKQNQKEPSKTSNPDEANASLTGLSAPNDEHLEGKYRDLDTGLASMLANTQEAMRETLGLKEGEKLPRPMTVYLQVSGQPGAPKEISLQSIKAGANFHHRINSVPPLYRTSADLSVAAKQKVDTISLPGYVDLATITDDQGRIAIKINPDGSHELIRPDRPVDQQVPGNS